MKLNQLNVPSPCVAICALDEQDICIGCQRTAQEITRWSQMESAEKEAVLQACQQRARENNLIME
ncbi:DUF1289 domain-containing protein [Endozoicomonadaceae bacterium StTr2]